MPNGRQEVDLEEVVVLFTDPEEVEQGRSHLVIVIMVVMVVLIFIMIVISSFFSRKSAHKDLIHSGWVQQKCENVAKEGSKRSLDSRKVDSAG